MNKQLHLSLLLLFIVGINPNGFAQDIVTQDPCFGTLNWYLQGTDGTGRNFYQDDTQGQYIRWDVLSNQWEMSTANQDEQFPGMTDQYFYWNSTFASTPNPPDLATGTWQVVACGPTSIGGSGTQAVLFLPVELTRFEALKKGNDIELIWSTATEINNDKFEIEYSSDGVAFKKLGEVEGHGNSLTEKTYSFIDRNPGPGNHYYRLKQIDYDRQFEYSKVVSVSFNYKESQIGRLFPNPNSGQSVSFSYFTDQDDQLSIAVFDAAGQLLSTETRELSKGKNSLNMDCSGFGPGVYFIKLEDRINLSHQKLIVK